LHLCHLLEKGGTKKIRDFGKSAAKITFWKKILLEKVRQKNTFRKSIAKISEIWEKYDKN